MGAPTHPHGRERTGERSRHDGAMPRYASIVPPLVPLRIRGNAHAPAPAPRPGERLEVGLVLTHACNLACTYCYTGEKKRVRMSAAIAEAALDFAFSTATHSGAHLQLGFFGGEPLLEQALLLAIAEQARARAASAGPWPLQLQVTTNGTLLGPDLIEELARLRVHVALSLDGTRTQHEAGRPLAGGGSSYDATVAGLRLLVAARVPFDVIAVVDPCNVAELARGVEAMIDDGVESITLNMNWGAAWDDAALDELDRQLERVAAIVLAWVRRGRWIHVQPLESAVRSVLELGHAVNSHCAAGSRRLAVAPSGRLYGCARAVGEDDGRAAIGDIHRGVIAPSIADAHGCTCANTEETGDPMVAGRIRIRHDLVLEQLARRLAAALGESFTQIVVTETGA